MRAFSLVLPQQTRLISNYFTVQNWEVADMFCGSCGSTMEQDAVFCGSCGAKVEIKAKPQSNVPQQSNITAQSNVPQQTYNMQKSPTSRLMPIVLILVLLVGVAGAVGGIFIGQIFLSPEHTSDEITSNGAIIDPAALDVTDGHVAPAIEPVTPSTESVTEYDPAPAELAPTTSVVEPVTPVTEDVAPVAEPESDPIAVEADNTAPDVVTDAPTAESVVVSEGFILPFSSSRYLTQYDLWGLNIEELRIARNEIYARHGRRFRDEELQAHFDAMPWYIPTLLLGEEPLLTDLERANVELIQVFEGSF